MMFGRMCCIEPGGFGSCRRRVFVLVMVPLVVLVCFAFELLVFLREASTPTPNTTGRIQHQHRAWAQVSFDCLYNALLIQVCIIPILGLKYVNLQYLLWAVWIWRDGDGRTTASC